MLDTETKRRIDSARDILVGKVPDPKSQVEQITIALIYKFMNDMDVEAEGLGDKRNFFAGEWERYGWAKLMRSGLGGHEVLKLYRKAIIRMPENPGIPALFRDIFKNAYLPYRDPETLKSFLKIIDEFEYDDSERLGDAFEYLLSVLGSQGDAGQFRTPRHIIEFMVEIIDPKKVETVLDPACGTAGFLISAYKHIRRNNKDKKGNSTLTHDERGRLAKNFNGYDISPDMVRLSLVNLYLHDFKDPHIYEYDTLTSEDKWNEFADVILANPPFMSPKGGIKPHKRFTIHQAKRSEVLFVDYIAEHLTPAGRAGIIVPEGIIFQSQIAYKQLRKMLVDEYLVAVISLPAGCFNPYSGVKTSILILNKSLARQSNSIAFFKVENDGFGLGAQRRAIEKNDLPQVQSELEEYLHALRNNKPIEELQPTLGLIVEREKVAKNEEYNLNGERYREGNKKSSKFPWVELGDILLGKPQYGSGSRKVSYDGAIRYIRITDLTDRGDLKEIDPVSPSTIEENYFLEYGDFLIARSGSVGRTYLHQKTSGCFQYAGYLIRFRINPTKALPAFVFQITKSPHWGNWITSQSKTGTISNINAKQYSSFQLPLPPLEMQKEIVAEVEGYQKVINGARTVLENYRSYICIHPDWPMVELGELLEKFGDMVLPETLEGPVTYIGLENITQATGEICGQTVSESPSKIKSLKNLFKPGQILYGKLRPNLNKVWLADRSGICSTDIFVIQPKSQNTISGFYSILLRNESFNSTVMSFIEGAQLPRIGWSSFASIMIPNPQPEVQQAIMAKVEAEQALVSANRELITRFEKKIQATLARIWSEEAAATET